MAQERTDVTPWYRQFWPWFLISIPLGTIVAAMFTIHLAVKSSDGLVADDYYKKGLAIHMDADALRRARALGIRADVRIDYPARRLELRLEDDAAQAHGPLEIALRHPTRATGDLLLRLRPDGPGRYRAELPEDTARVNWVIQLTAPERGWRLHGRIDTNEDRSQLLLH